MSSKNTENSEQSSECFTEQRLETLDNELLRNVSSKSVILAPFNSTFTHLSTWEQKEITRMTKRKGSVIWFEARVRDIDRQYEINNNGELDNGVYNKFVNNSFKNDEEDKGNYE